MLRTFYDFDAKLRSTGQYFKRFTSLSALPFDAFHNKSNVSDEMVRHYERLITKQLISKFAIPQLSRSDFGQLVNVDEALEGIPECFRHTRPIKSVLKIGLNVSGDAFADDDVFAMRAAAVLAIVGLAKSRGQKVQFDTCYGWYGFGRGTKNSPLSHFRISCQTLTPGIIKSIMVLRFRNQMIDHVVGPFSHTAGYRLWKIAEDFPQFGNEFDFVLDRIETADKDTEYARILQQIERLK
jgi:hypothetical protein